MLDIREFKTYIYENNYIEQILVSIGCHHIKHRSGFWQCANADGDNATAICVYENEYLTAINYTRQMVSTNRATDLIDLVCYTKKLLFPEGLKYICQEIGLSYYHDFEEDMPECFKILKLLDDMDSNSNIEKEKPLIPISEQILSYYKPYVNDLFYEDNIDYSTQREFEIGFDEETNRYTIPIRSELGDLVGVKARYFHRDVPEGENKYIYLERCAKSRILYGLYKTATYIKNKNFVFVLESEKGTLQLWGYGYKNCVSTGGKELSQYQIDMLIRLGVNIIFAFDKDVTKKEIEDIADRFPDGISIYYIYDENDLLEQKESPSDDPVKWEKLLKNNLYKMR